MKYLIILLLSALLCGCQNQVVQDKVVHGVSEKDDVVDSNSVLYTGGTSEDIGIKEVENISSNFRYTDTEFISTDVIPYSLSESLSGELPAVQTAVLSVLYKYCYELGINYELLHWQSPISEPCDNHTVYLLAGLTSDIRIHVAHTDRVVACIE